MNAEEKLKAFKAEIEQRKSSLYSGQLDKFTSCKIGLYDSMLNYLDSLPGESSMTDIVDGPSYKCVRNTETFVVGEIYYSGVDTQGGIWIYDKNGKGWLLGYMSDCFVQFAGVKPRLIERDDLEGAAEQYGKEDTILPDYYNDGDIPDYERWTADAFKAGAEWQKAQDQQTIELAEEHALLAGMIQERERMMKDAIDATIVETQVGYTGSELDLLISIPESLGLKDGLRR